VIQQMPFHQKTEDTIKEFDDAWKEFVVKNNLRLVNGRVVAKH
jgi:hypothetical protein